MDFEFLGSVTLRGWYRIGLAEPHPVILAGGDTNIVVSVLDVIVSPVAVPGQEVKGTAKAQTNNM